MIKIRIRYNVGPFKTHFFSYYTLTKGSFSSRLSYFGREHLNFRCRNFAAGPHPKPVRFVPSRLTQPVASRKTTTEIGGPKRDDKRFRAEESLFRESLTGFLSPRSQFSPRAFHVRSVENSAPHWQRFTKVLRSIIIPPILFIFMWAG
jgi:hypothetical protein